MPSVEPESTESSPGEDGNGDSYNFIIFLIATLFSGLDVFLVRVVVAKSIFAPVTSGIGVLGGLSPLTIISYLFYPVLFFIVLYFLANKIDIAKYRRRVALLLFAGGTSGNLLGTLFGLFYSSTTLGTSLGLEPVFAGLFSFFSGFSAMALSRLRGNAFN